ncbi:MAG: aldo/keto reductase [Thermobacillus sp. ZCTH02-B1]|nr:MAG: aldo/keto reductase [Thermobacillus sp. ZCTH02-B1]
MRMMGKKKLGRTDIEVSAVGFGCWPIGGQFLLDGHPDGYGEVNDDVSIRAIERALELGIQFFDTADVYGTGHSEEVLGRALKGRRHEAVIATKFGFTYDEATRNVYTKINVSPDYIVRACERSLRRLGTDYIDLYQIHPGSIPDDRIDSVIHSLERLKEKGWIRAYGWSTEDPEAAETFAARSGAAAFQHPLNVLADSPMVELCARHGLTSINNMPLAMGLLSGKFNRSSQLPADDVRGSMHAWVRYFKNGRPVPEYLDALDAIREVLTSGGRTLVQGALCWIWGRGAHTVPIPGIKHPAQAEEAAKAMAFGPLSPEQMAEIDRILRNLDAEVNRAG